MITEELKRCLEQEDLAFFDRSAGGSNVRNTKGGSRRCVDVIEAHAVDGSRCNLDVM
jgi:hypothetical protein